MDELVRTASTPAEAARAACYWAGDAPWVVVVPISKAPKWAVDAAEEAARSSYREEL